MGILDARNEFCDATSTGAVAAGANAMLGNQIDLGSPGFGGTPTVRNFPGDGTPLYFVMTVDTTFVAAVNGSLSTFWLMSDDTASFTFATASVHYQSRAFTANTAAHADTTAGAVLVVTPLPILSASTVAASSGGYERFLGVAISVATQNLTSGKVNAFLVRDPSRYMILPDGLPATA